MLVKFFSFLALCAVMISSADAALLGLNNTGGAGWSLTSKPLLAGSLTTVTTPNVSWGSLPGSSWISDRANTNVNSSPLGDYIFETSFNLTGVSKGMNQLSLVMNILHDNYLEFSLNGAVKVPLGSVNRFDVPALQLSFNENDVNWNAVNTLTFRVKNISGEGVNPVGLNVRFASQEYGVVPEPASVALWGGAIVGLVFLRRRKALS
jgi:hypothetical protein